MTCKSVCESGYVATPKRHFAQVAVLQLPNDTYFHAKDAVWQLHTCTSWQQQAEQAGWLLPRQRCAAKVAAWQLALTDVLRKLMCGNSKLTTAFCSQLTTLLRKLMCCESGCVANYKLTNEWRKSLPLAPLLLLRLLLLLLWLVRSLRSLSLIHI